MPQLRPSGHADWWGDQMKKIIALAGAMLSALLIGCAPSGLPITHHAATPASQPTTHREGKPDSQPGAHHTPKAGSQPGAHHALKAGSAHHVAKPAVTQLTDRQTCLYLRDDILRNGGTPRTKTLRYLAARGPHWMYGLPGSPSLWKSAIADVRTGQMSRIRFDLTRFSSFCRPAGVQIPQG